jgi:hypothetical protein
MPEIRSKKVTLVYDANGSPVQGALNPAVTTVITFTDTAGMNSDPIIAQAVRLIATADCFIKFQDLDDSKASASDMLLKAGQAEYFSLEERRYVSAVNASGSTENKLFVTLMQ